MHVQSCICVIIFTIMRLKERLDMYFILELSLPPPIPILCDVRTPLHRSAAMVASTAVPWRSNIRLQYKIIIIMIITRSILKKISDVVTLGTSCYRDQSFINRRGSFIFSRKERYWTWPPPHTHTHTHTHTRSKYKNFRPPSDKTFLRCFCIVAIFC